MRSKTAQVLSTITLGGLLWAQDAAVQAPAKPDTPANTKVEAPAKPVPTANALVPPVPATGGPDPEEEGGLAASNARLAESNARMQSMVDAQRAAVAAVKDTMKGRQYVGADVNGTTTTFESQYNLNGHSMSVSVGDAYTFNVEVEFPVVDEDNRVDSDTISSELDRIVSEEDETGLDSITKVVLSQQQDGNGNGVTEAIVDHRESFVSRLVAYIKGGRNGQRNDYKVGGEGMGAYDGTFSQPTVTTSEAASQTVQETQVEQPETGAE